MAKQTFTTGQVLTAAQMTSLQETAMGGGPATAKTASYVLVAADAGTTVAMNAAGSTTITVNTGLFAAGDTVFIQNLGAGACTITAGTATVATAGSLILPQNDAGILYFTSAGAAIFYDYIQAGAVSPLTTKGDLYTYSTSDTRLAVGTNGQTLVADSAEATGLKWATASSGGMTVISSGNLTGTSISVGSISGYNDLQVVLRNAYNQSGGGSIQIYVNGDTGAYYNKNMLRSNSGHTYTTGANGWGMDDAAYAPAAASNANSYVLTLFDVANTTSQKMCEGNFVFTRSDSARVLVLFNGIYTNGTAAITSIGIKPESGSFGGGTYIVYGVK